MSEPDFREYNNCFACGSENPVGLHVSPQRADGRSRLTWQPGDDYEGYRTVIHGGIVSTLLDEAMAYAALSLFKNCATAEMTVRFRKPVMVEGEVIIEGRVVDRKRRVIHTEAILRQDGVEKATATGKFICLGENKIID
jgi:uncharacterized protein (TIGR00369 family)